MWSARIGVPPERALRTRGDFSPPTCGDRIAENAVLEYSPTEILPQVARYWRALRLSADRATGAPGHTRGKGRRLGAASPAAAKFTAETDSLVEGEGFDPSVPRDRDDGFRSHYAAPTLGPPSLTGALARATRPTPPSGSPERPIVRGDELGERFARHAWGAFMDKA